MGKVVEMIKEAFLEPTSPSYFGGAYLVWKQVKKHASLARVKQVLSHLDSYTLHKPITKRYSRSHMTSPGLWFKAQIDLIDLNNLKEHNDKVCYILVCVDVFSRQAQCEPLINKTADETLFAFEQMERIPSYIYCDKGKEFEGEFREYCDKKGINLIYATSDDVKCAIVERWIRTFKTRLWRYFTEHDTLRYVDVLQDLVYAINNSYHRILKRTPASITQKNQHEVARPDEIAKGKIKFNIGDQVRLALEKGKLEKGYRQNFTKEIYTVSKVLRRRPIAYRVAGRKGVFYTQEMQAVNY